MESGCLCSEYRTLAALMTCAGTVGPVLLKFPVDCKGSVLLSVCLFEVRNCFISKTVCGSE
jgi:hypothetical protein